MLPLNCYEMLWIQKCFCVFCVVVFCVLCVCVRACIFLLLLLFIFCVFVHLYEFARVLLVVTSALLCTFFGYECFKRVATVCGC